MGIGCSRSPQRENRNGGAPVQGPAAPYEYPQHQQYPAYRRDSPRPVGLNPYASYPQPYGQNPRPMPPTHAVQHGNTPPTHASAAHTELPQTRTIRNQVNLKKPSLKMIHSDGDENKIVPHFVFDASAPCSVTVFYMAMEDITKKSKLTPIMQQPGPRANYDKGLAQAFPPKGKEAEYALDLSLYDEEHLTRVNGDVTFPLIVRLETVTDNSNEEHTLDALSPGCPTPRWVQSQTTYAYLIRDGDKWEPRTVKQKIWVDGISYELQEIFGIQDFYTPEKKAEKLDTYSDDIEGRECVICLAVLRDTTVLPCRHMCMCAGCAREIQRQQVSACPICRDPIESLLYIKRPRKDDSKE